MTTTEATAYNCVRRGVARTRAELARVMGVRDKTQIEAFGSPAAIWAKSSE